MSGGPAAALEAVTPRLRCPHCGAPVVLDGGTIACARGHRYDVARHGYVSLFAAGRRPHTGDTPEMVAAREAFLAAGHYAPIVAAVVDAAVDAARSSTARPATAVPSLTGAPPRAAAPHTTAGPVAAPPLVVELGAGTGHYLAAVLERVPGRWGLALDASRDALRRAVRAHSRIAGIACDVWRPLPVAGCAADMMLNVFAPRHAEEIARVLAPGGAFIVVTPAPAHLEELVAPMGMLAVGEDKHDRLRDALAPHLEAVAEQPVEFGLSLNRTDARALVAMGPSAHHVAPSELERRLASLPDLTAVTASVVVETFRRR